MHIPEGHIYVSALIAPKRDLDLTNEVEFILEKGTWSFRTLADRIAFTRNIASSWVVQSCWILDEGTNKVEDVTELVASTFAKEYA